MKFEITTELFVSTHGRRGVKFHVARDDEHWGTFADWTRARNAIGDELSVEFNRVFREARDMTDDEIRAIGLR